MSEGIQNLHIPKRPISSDKGITVLAGDVGGTKVNLALYHADNSGLKQLEQERYPSEEFTSCIDVIAKFLEEKKLPAPNRVCLGVAGPVLDGKVDLTNLNWLLDKRDIEKQFSVKEVALINDLEAIAYGLPCLKAEDFIVLHKGHDKGKGNMAIVAPGTGLGEAGLYWSGTIHFPFPTEGGHCDFSPRTDLDILLLKYMQQKYGIVSWEKVVAGPAVYDIYCFLRDVMHREEPGSLTEAIKKAEDPSALISQAAIKKEAAICIETMDHFVRYLAREASNLVLKIKATGGLFLGGGIPPKIAPLLVQKSFYEHFMDCDRMQHLLENVPLRIIKNDNTGLFGAAYFGAYCI
jgi:glucokinase